MLTPEDRDTLATFWGWCVECLVVLTPPVVLVAVCVAAFWIGGGTP